jgi:hypothetical protein
MAEDHRSGSGRKTAQKRTRQRIDEAPAPVRISEEEEDRLDIAEAERRLSDPEEVPIPYEQARKTLGLD